MKGSRIFLLLLVMLSTNVRAQQSGVWHHFANSTTPTCMMKDGPYLWIGTEGGVVKFDRRTDTFHIFNSANSGLMQNSIHRIIRDKAGAIWTVMRAGGVASFANGVWTSYTTSNSGLGENNNGDIAADSLGRVWIAGGGTSGLTEYDHGKWTTYNSSNSPLTPGSVYGVGADRTGSVWVAMRGAISDTIPSLFKFDGVSSWEQHSKLTDTGYYYQNTFSIMIARDSSVWLGTEGYFEHLKGRTWDITPAKPDANNGPAHNYVFSMAEDSAGGVWAATGYGIAYFDGKTWHPRTKYDTVSSRFYPFEGCRGVVLDGGDLWASGYEADGIAKLHDTTWTVFGNLSNCTLGSNYPKAMTIDSRGRYWFGLRDVGGLSMFDGSHWTNYDSVTQGQEVLALAADSVGNVWVGLGGGLATFDGEHVHRYNLNAMDSFSNVVYSIMYDKRRNAVWVGNGWQGGSSMKSGLMRLAEGYWTVYKYPQIYGQIMALTMDTAGKIWAAPYTENITEFDGDTTWKYYTPSNSALPSLYVFDLASDAKGNVWAATLGGPAKWDGASWTALSGSGILNGLDACTLDAKGNIWFGAFPDMGIGGGACMYDGKTWTDFTTANSGIGSGMIWSTMAGKHGELWFGSNGDGLAEFIPNVQASVMTGASQPISNLICFPNPATSSVHCMIEQLGDSPAIIDVLDILGREAMTLTAKHGNDFTVDAQLLCNGVYTIIVKGEDRVVTGQFVVKR